MRELLAERRTKIVSFHVTEGMRAALQARAQQADQTLSAYLASALAELLGMPAIGRDVSTSPVAVYAKRKRRAWLALGRCTRCGGKRDRQKADGRPLKICKKCAARNGYHDVPDALLEALEETA